MKPVLFFFLISKYCTLLQIRPYYWTDEYPRRYLSIRNDPDTLIDNYKNTIHIGKGTNMV